ncbi:hypothetical protein E4T56_gene2594 [Termitomyces sp. T112]|nr:hypothetical protein E4T56_gene2594 [Termitomyces sp. T112]
MCSSCCLHDLRENIGKVRATVSKRLEEGKEEGWAWVDEYEEIVRQLTRRLEMPNDPLFKLKQKSRAFKDKRGTGPLIGEGTHTNQIDACLATQNGTVPIENVVVKDEKTGLDVLPWWIAQPYSSPLPPDVPADLHGKKAGKVKIVEAQKAKDQKALLHDSTNR